MALCRNGVVSEWRCVGIALCQNGDMSGYDLSGFLIFSDKQTDNHGKWGSENRWILRIVGCSRVCYKRG